MHVRYSFEEKSGGMHMANQSLARRQTSEVVVNHHTPGHVVQRTQRQLQEIGGVITTAVVEYDRTRYEVEGIVSKSGRSQGHQRYVEERAASLMCIYDSAVNTVVKNAVNTIIQEGPTEIVRTVYVPEPRKSLFQQLTGR
jgi:hypothetical protein